MGGNGVADAACINAAAAPGISILRGATEVTEYFVHGARLGQDGQLLTEDGQPLGTYWVTARFVLPHRHRWDSRCHVHATIQGRTYFAGTVDAAKGVFTGRRLAAELAALKQASAVR